MSSGFGESVAGFVEECRAAVVDGGAGRAGIVDAVTRLVNDPIRLAEIRTPAEDEGDPTGVDETWYEGDDVTVMVIHTRPGLDQPPHDHLIDAVIGVYDGNERQRFFRRIEGQDTIEPSGGRDLGPGEVLTLGDRAIHAISAAPPNDAASDQAAWSRAVHVYLGNLGAIDRSLFDPDTLAEVPLTMDQYYAWCRPTGSF